MKKSKRILSLILCFIMAVTTLCGTTLTATAATSSTIVTTLKKVLPVATYAAPSSGASKVYAYSSSSLTTKQPKYYINTYTEQIVIIDISSDGKAVKVTYPNSSGVYRTKWFKTDDILGLTTVKTSTFKASSSMSVYRMKSSSTVTSYGTISKSNDTCYQLGTHKLRSKTYYTTVYKLSSVTKVNGVNVKYKIGLTSTSGTSVSKNSTNSSTNENTTLTSFKPVWPCKNSNYISAMYRYYNSGNPKNHGVRSNIYNAFDVAGSFGDTIYAVEKGTVVDKGYQSNGFGYYVVIKHENGLYSLYAHLKNSAKVSIGASISRKQVIGYMGSTGNSSGNHLHFELYNPKNYSKVINPWTSYYQGKVSVTVGGNSYRANINYKSDSYAQSWCKWAAHKILCK